jgi:hypothetical protein
MALGLAVAPAQAAPQHTRVTVPLTVLSAAGGVQPQDTGTGNCGSVWIDVSGAGGQGTFDYGFQSSLGIVVFRTLTVRWANVRDAVIHAFDDNGIQFSSRFSNTKTEATGSGTVVSRLVTVIRHLNGTLCIGYVGDTGTVG